MIGLNIVRYYTRMADGANHQGGTLSVYDADTLDAVKHWGQVGGHQFDNSTMIDSQGNFVSLTIGDNYPRGIDLTQWNRTSRSGQVLMRFKTEHGTDPRGGNYGEYTEISTDTTTYYKWSNDTQIYSELGGVVEMDDRFISFMSSERGLDNLLTARGHNLARNLVAVSTGKNTSENRYLTFGEYESAEYYTFSGGYAKQEHQNLVWLTDFKGIQQNISRLKALKLADNIILLLMEIHTYDGYDHSAYMMVNKDLQVLVPITRMHEDIIFNRSHDLLVENGVAYGYSSANGKLQRFTIRLNGDPTIDSDNDGYGDYYEQLLGSDANDPNSPLTNGDIDTDSDSIPDHMDYDDDADSIWDRDDSAPTDPNSDYDGDGLTDGYETSMGLNPFDSFDRNTDSDNDGIWDVNEFLYGLDPNDPSDGENIDSDLDGFTNGQEVSVGTDPLDANVYDADGDGVLGLVDLNDGNPHSDTDGDGISDILETSLNFNPTDPSDIDFSIDANNDGEADIWESLQAALPAQGEMNISQWSSHIEQMAAPAQTLVADFINIPRQHSVDLSGLSGQVSYEFIVKFAQDNTGILELLGHRNNTEGINTAWGIRFEQSDGNMGVTQFGVMDYQFTPLYGQTIASPYGDPVHLVVVGRNGTTEAWVNGELVGRISANSILINDPNTPLGINSGTISGDDGIYGFAAHNYALSAQEIELAHRKALSIYFDSDGDGIYDVIDPDDDNDGYLDNGDQDTSGYGTGQAVAGVLVDINALLANNQTIDEALLVESGYFSHIISDNMALYNDEFTRLGTLTSSAQLQNVINTVNTSVSVLMEIVGYANANDANNLSFADLSSVMGLTALVANNHAYYKALIAADVGNNVDTAAKLQTLIDSANASQAQIDVISQYAANDNANALTIAMLQSIAGLSVDSNNLSYYKEFVADSAAADIIDLASLQLIINDADAFALDPQWAVTGQAVANNISGATVRVYAIESGAKGANITHTEGTTDANGAFSMAIVPTTLPVMMEISGGSYQDEATGNTITNTTLTSVLPEIARRDAVTVSPLTDIAAKVAATDLTVAGINSANALIASTFLDSTHADDVFAIAPAAMDTTGTGLAQQYRTALIGLSVLGGGEALANVTQDIATDLSDNSLNANTAKALYLNTQTWLRRHGMTDLALNVPTFGLDSAAQQAVDTAFANDLTLAYFPEVLQTSTGSLDLTALLSGYVPTGSSVSVSVLEGDSLTALTGTFDTSLYSSGAQIQVSVDVDGVARLETITLQPSAPPVSVTSTLGDINNGSHSFTVTASDSQSVTIESLTPDVATFANDSISVLTDGVARLAITSEDNAWQEIVSLEVLSPRTAPSITWQLDNNGDLQVASINGDNNHVSLSYQGSDSSLTMMMLLPVDRNASDSISWMVEKYGVRYSMVQNVDVADVVNPLAMNNLTARVSDTSITDADLLAEFMGLVDVATDATTLGLYRNELSSNSVSSITALQTLITEQNLTATAFIDLQNTDVASITLVQLQALMPEQVLHESIVDDYRTALADNTWMSPSDVQSLIVDVNDELTLAFGPTGDYDRDGIINSEDPDADNDGINNEYELAAGFDPYDSADIDFSIDNNYDGKADIWFTIQAAMPTSGMDIDTWNAHIIAQNIPPEVVVNTFINQSAQETVNLSTLGGEVSYEFIVHFAVDRSNSLAIFGNSASGWSLRLEQWSDTNKLGVTRYGAGDYTFDALSGQSVSSPYGDPAHVIYITRSGITEIWVNGIQVGELTNQALLINHSSVPIGIMEGTVEGDEGIYGFAAYNHALSQDEITSAHQNALDVYVDSDSDGIYDRLDPDDDNDGYLDNGDPDTTGYGTGQVLAGVLGDINDLLANNQNIDESLLIDSSRFTNITSANMTQYNIELALVGNFGSIAEVQGLIDDVNASITALAAIVDFANGNDASTLTVTQLNSVMNLSGIDANNLLYYQTLISNEFGSNVDTSTKLQTLITSANSSQSQIDSISQYAENNNANALTIAMLQGIAGLTLDTNNLAYYQDFIEESEAQDVSDLVKLQILVNDADAFAQDPQWAITGQAVANNISGAMVRVYAIETGAKGTDLTKTAGTTDASGAFSMTIVPTALPVIMEISGGVYIDEATGISINNGTLTTLLPEIARRDNVTVSPLTDIAAKVAATDLSVTGINGANALIASTFLDSANADDVFAIAPAAMNATGTGIAQQYRTALIGLSVLGGGEKLANVTQDLATDLADNILDVNTAKALYLNTQTWLRRHSMTDLALNVPTYGLDSAAQQAVDTAFTNDPTLAYFPEILQTNTGSLDLVDLLSTYVPSGSNLSVSVLDGDSLTDVTSGTLDTSLYSSGAQLHVSVDVEGVTRFETITMQPTASPVSITSVLGDLTNGAHTITVTPSDNQLVTIENLTPDVTSLVNTSMTITQDGIARFVVTAADNEWQEVVSVDVLVPRTAPSVDWALDADGDLQVENITGDSSFVTLTYQGTDASLSLMTNLAVDRNANDSLDWAVVKNGVRFSPVISQTVISIVNPLALDNLSTRVADNTISDADVFAEFIGLTLLSNDASTLSLYRSELTNNPVTSLAALESTISDTNGIAAPLLICKTRRLPVLPSHKSKLYCLVNI
ncbi:hypothetical protein BCU50_002405 [Vibrio sp. 10N.286.46.E10]|uniref:hypothetical protein n=1 Tax=Vibrio sp. 10N.286.46.E10 TaxID=1884477 RepID=UPI0039A42E06